MSMHQLAHHLQSAGRGEDKVLVHMTPKEVNGLQALAMSQGGSLTINPETGLPEAGILSALLPMVAGFFLGPAGLQLTAMQSALTVGALGTAATGSLGKGFMMGLGAYGGAGLGEGLIKAGASAAPNAVNAGANATANATANAAGLADDAVASGITGGGQTINSGAGLRAKLDLASATPETVSGLQNAGGLPAYSPNSALNTLNKGIANPLVETNPMANYIKTHPMGYVPPTPPATPLPNVDAMAADAAKSVNPIDGLSGKTVYPEAVKNSSSFGNWDGVKKGFDKLTSGWDGAKEVWNATPTGTGYGLAATGMSALQAQQEEAAKKAKAKADALAAERRGYMRPYDFSTEQDPSAYANTSTAESRYFVEPRFTARPIEKIAKEGGLMSLAVGGAVEEMSAQNAISANTMYPQSQLQTTMYSNPMMSRPMPTNVIQSGLDAPTNAYTGEAKFASGGAAAKKAEPTTSSKYTYDPATMQYTQTTTTTPASSNPANNPFFGKIGIPGFGYQPKVGGQQAAQQPTTTTETLGGIAAPYVPPNQEVLAQTPAPAINIPQPQNVNQQLGLEGFYNMMGDQLAMKGAQMQAQGYAAGGISDLGGYSDGGRLLRGPGDGVSDSIPASIGDRQPARLADGEFVVPARIVSEIGNGSTEAGARKLYAMMDRVQKARKKTVGKNQVAKNTKADKLLPA